MAEAYHLKALSPFIRLPNRWVRDDQEADAFVVMPSKEQTTSGACLTMDRIKSGSMSNPESRTPGPRSHHSSACRTDQPGTRRSPLRVVGIYAGCKLARS